MSQDLTRYFQSLDEFRQRAREALAPARCELAAWFRDLFRRRKGPAKASHLALELVSESETPRPRFEFGWYPGMHSRACIFTPSQPVPVFATEADALAVGLHASDVPELLSGAFQDMAAEAWVQVDGPSFPKQFLTGYDPSEGPDALPQWVKYLREQICKEAAGTRRQPARWGLGPPEPLGLPAVPGELTEAVRTGVATALSDWADALDRAGASEAAGLLRWLPRIHASLADAVRAVSPQFGFAITVNSNRTAWWWVGDTGSESDNEEARQLERLMSAWNETHPAVEWLLRTFGFPHVTVEAIRYATDEQVPTRRYDLTAGQHLGPLEDDERVLKLDVAGWLPIEGLPEGN